VIAGAREHGARHVWVSTLRLVPLVKEHYLGVVGETYPELLPRYERAYAGANAPAPYRAAIERRVERIRARHGFSENHRAEPEKHLPEARPAASTNTPRQLVLAL
jgi:hypothetical protein